MVIDDASSDDLQSALGTTWRGVSDRVMGGLSRATLSRDRVDGRRCLRLSGPVRLDNNGGFIQASLELAPAGGSLDLSPFSAIHLLVRGNDERYSVHLRTADVYRPWQSYRAQFDASEHWHEVVLPLSAFEPHRIEVPLDLTRVRRLGVVAIGRAFDADLALARIEVR